MGDLINAASSVDQNNFIFVAVIIAMIGGGQIFIKVVSLAFEYFMKKPPEAKSEKKPDDINNSCVMHTVKIRDLDERASSIKSTVEETGRNVSVIKDLVTRTNEHQIPYIYVPSELMDEIRKVLNAINKIPVDKIPVDMVSGLLHKMNAVENALKDGN